MDGALDQTKRLKSMKTNGQNSEQNKKTNIMRDAFFGLAVSSGVGFVVAGVLMALVFSLSQ
jgi:hypothetical protein